MTKVRAFLAFNIPSKVQQKLGILIHDLEKRAPEVNWLSPPDLHVTLCFFGEVPEPQLMQEMVPMICPVIGHEPPLDLECSGIGVFPNWKYPRVIWAGISGDTDRLILLHDHIAEVMKPFKLKKDRRLFRPHLTIGRAKEIKGTQMVKLVEHLGPIAFGHVPVREAVLFKSELHHDRPVYTPLQTFPFGHLYHRG